MENRKIFKFPRNRFQMTVEIYSPFFLGVPLKVSQLFVQTLREAPSDAVLPSHTLLMRGGYIKPISAGIFSLYPLGKRVIRKIEAIIREEMEKIEGQEVELPLVQSADLWKNTGRYEAIGSELLRFQDRTGHDMVLAMTHEEAVTDLAAATLKSYKQLPFMLFQIQSKYRDEARARGGLIRVKEFTMKDAYSFHKDEADLDQYYDRAHQAYLNIFRRVGIEPVVVQSDTGIMGGKVAHEFMLETENGEDYLTICRSCGFQANAEIAPFKRSENKADLLELEKVATPGRESIEDVSSFLEVEQTQTAKMVFFESEGQLIAVMTQGHLELSEIKVKNHLKTNDLVPADAEKIKEAGMVPGFASPVSTDLEGYTLLVDESVTLNNNLVCGANEVDFHFKNFNLDRDVSGEYQVGDFAQADTGCACSSCGAKLEATRGIEIGNIFKLGTKFSEALGAQFLDEGGKRQTAIMGCYGIGVGRLMASVVEEHHDDWGISWPKSIAPFQVQLCTIGKDSEALNASESLYNQLKEKGFEVLWDDRNERPGVKFKDADLFGIPVRVSVGGKALKEGKYEFKLRGGKGFDLLTPEETLARVVDEYK